MRSDSLAAVFIDRDGTIIEDTHYPKDPEHVVLIPSAAEGLRLMSEKGYLLFVVSNQSGVARGIISDGEFKAVHQRVTEVLQQAGVEIAEFSYCLHHPSDDCGCRKPQPGIVPRAYQGIPLDLKRSYMIGDKDCDLCLADNIGATGILVLTGKGPETHDTLRHEGRLQGYEVAANLLEVAKRLPSLS